MRTGTTLKWILGDHLNSTAITANADGSFYGSLRYKPWGEVRYANGTTPTKYTYTADFGLMFYGARWYDPYLNRYQTWYYNSNHRGYGTCRLDDFAVAHFLLHPRP